MLNPDIEALARDLEALSSSASAPEIADARDAVRRASEAASRDGRPAAGGSDAERAVTLARMAMDRARQAVGMAPRASWREALRGPATPANGLPLAGRRPPAGRYPDLDLDSEIPDAHPAKSAIEASIAGAFAGVKGRWRVAILVQPTASWWGIRVEGQSICWTGTLEGPDEQSPEFLAGRVREAVQLGLMQAALPKPRSRG